MGPRRRCAPEWYRRKFPKSPTCKCCGKYAAIYTVNSCRQVISGNEICCYCKDVYEKIRDEAEEDRVRTYMVRKGHL
jgi:hypothetical protein